MEEEVGKDGRFGWPVQDWMEGLQCSAGRKLQETIISCVWHFIQLYIVLYSITYIPKTSFIIYSYPLVLFHLRLPDTQLLPRTTQYLFLSSITQSYLRLIKIQSYLKLLLLLFFTQCYLVRPKHNLKTTLYLFHLKLHNIKSYLISHI